MSKSVFLQTEVDGEIISTRELYGNLKLVHQEDLEVIIEDLQAALYDLTQGVPTDGIQVMRRCVDYLQDLIYNNEVKV